MGPNGAGKSTLLEVLTTQLNRLQVPSNLIMFLFAVVNPSRNITPVLGLFASASPVTPTTCGPALGLPSVYTCGFKRHEPQDAEQQISKVFCNSDLDLKPTRRRD
ncbi:P-loop NTPase family protein [Lactiplantibacillus plantarum]|uniref:hypothetical protein n=1 Tax=Lactiplantibacillus plantarum TaxID=1590 RepID=UPI0021CB4B8B|nr:hypothetical protein [Lactiplantibacillus plantarum]